MSYVSAKELMEILPEASFRELVQLEKLRLQLKEKVRIERGEQGEWQIDFSRTAKDGTPLVNEIFIRRANYELSIVELFRIYYAVLDVYIRKVPIKEKNFSYRLGSFNLICLNGQKLMLNGAEVIEFPEEIRPYLISSMRNKTYFRWQDWTITPIATYFRNIKVESIPLYLFLEK